MKMRILTAGLGAALALAAASAQAVPEVKREPTFPKPGHIHGYLITPSGEGLRGMVALCAPNGKKISYHHTVMLRRGRFDIDNLQPGRYRLHVDTLGPDVRELTAPADMEVEVRSGQVSRPRLVAQPE